MELPEGYRGFPGAVGKLSKAMYGSVEAGGCWNMKLAATLQEMGCTQSPAGPCVFRKTADDGEADMFVVFHVDDILVAAGHTQPWRDLWWRWLESLLSVT